MKRILGWTLLLWLCQVALAQMAQTPNLGLNLPPQGYPTWNTLVNQNFSTLDLVVGGLQHQWQGTWTSAVTYQPAQLVAWQGSSYISISGTNANNQPDLSPGYWAKIGTSATGAVNELQMNAGGAFAPTTGMTYDVASNTLRAPGVTVSGQVGIGTTTPTTPLDVNGMIRGVTLKATSIPGGVAPVCANGATGELTSAGCAVPAGQVQWPPACTTGVYVPSTNTCVATTGTANNPAGSSGEIQYNVGGVFGAVTGSAVDGATLNAKYPASLAAGGVVQPAGFMNGLMAYPAYYNPNSAVDIVAAGAKGDARTGVSGRITVGSTTITGLAGVTSADVSKVFIGYGVGAAGATLVTTVATMVSATSVTVAVAPSSLGPPVAQSGTISTTAGGTAIVGVGTAFSSSLMVGQQLTANGETHTVASVTDATHMTTDAWTNANTGILWAITGAISWVIATDDQTAITRAQTTACAAPANGCLPIKVPRPPGGLFFLTSTITWHGLSYTGETVGSGSNSVLVSNLRGMPGQDLFLYPDTNDVATTLNSKTPIFQHLSLEVDGSVDASASHPHRKIGRTQNDAVTNSTATVTSAKMFCTAGDVGQQLRLTYPDTTTQTAVISSCNWSAKLVGANSITIANPTAVASGPVSIVGAASSAIIDTTIPQNGTISTTAGGTAVVGAGTNFAVSGGYAVGQKIVANGETHTIATITDATHLTTDAWTNLNSGVAFKISGLTGTVSVGQVAIVDSFPTNQLVTVTAVSGTTVTLSLPSNCKAGCSTAYASFYAPMNATETQSGVTIYISIAGAPVTQTIGNCAIAIDNRDGVAANWKVGASNAIALSFAVFRDMNVTAQGAILNNTGGFCLQGAIGMTYGTMWQNIKIAGVSYGVAIVPYDTNASNATVGFGGDFNIMHSMNIGSLYPLILYDGENWRIDQIQIAGGGVGPQILGSWSTTYVAPIAWDISIPEMEQNFPHAVGFRLEGNDHIVRNMSTSAGTFLGGTDIYWDATTSICEFCTPRALAVGGGGFQAHLVMGGIQNRFDLHDSMFAWAVDDDPTLGNQVTSLRSSNPNGSIQVSRALSQNQGRYGTILDETGDFLGINPTTPYNNNNDLLLWPRTIKFTGGFQPAIVLDPTAPSAGAYAVLPTSETWIGSYDLPANSLRVGDVVPAGSITEWWWVKCPTITSFTFNPDVRILTTNAVAHSFGIKTIPCSTTWTAQPYGPIDLSPYAGNVLGGVTGQTGEVDVALIGISPQISSTLLPIAGVSAGAIKSVACGTGFAANGSVAADGTPNCVSTSGLANTLGCLDGFDHIPCVVGKLSTTYSGTTGVSATVFYTNSTGGPLQVRMSGSSHPTVLGTAGTMQFQLGVAGAANACSGNSSVSISTATTSKYNSGAGGTACNATLQNGETVFYTLALTAATGTPTIEMHGYVERME